MIKSIKKIIKRIIPDRIMLLIANREYIKYKNKNPQQVFTDIYSKNRWGSQESISGTGSEIGQTEIVVKEVSNIIKQYGIRSVLDIPCGDFNWMQRVDLNGAQYVGADIVEDIVKKNSELHKTDNINFRVLNLLSDQLPHVDLIIVRDCFVHFSINHIKEAIQNIRKSGSTFLLTTTFVDCLVNDDIITGSYRKISLLAPPFNFPEPVLAINERCTEGNGENEDKSLVLWEIMKI